MFLLEQLRMCIDGAKGKRENEKNDPVLGTIACKVLKFSRYSSFSDQKAMLVFSFSFYLG